MALDPNTMSFVSPPIDQEIIKRFGDPRLLIPIYSKSSMTRYPFLLKYNLIPFRIGIGKAVFTRAKLFIDLPESASEPPILLTFDKKTLPVSLQSKIETEAKYLALGFEATVIRQGLDIQPESRISLGLFGKMNLDFAKVSLVDEQGTDHLLELSNVQFDLDFSVENRVRCLPNGS